MVFLGGAVLANIVSQPQDFPAHISLRQLTAIYIQMADKENMWITKQEWQEQGPRILEKLGPR